MDGLRYPKSHPMSRSEKIRNTKKDAENRRFFLISLGDVVQHEERQSTGLMSRQENNCRYVSGGGNEDDDGHRHRCRLQERQQNAENSQTRWPPPRSTLPLTPSKSRSKSYAALVLHSLI